MYLRVRKLNKSELKTGQHVLMVAEHMANGSIVTKPGLLEWWDGIEWKSINIVETEDQMEPV